MDLRDYSIVLDLRGGMSGTALAGVDTEFIFTMPGERFLTGLDYEAVMRNIGDNVEFYVMHPTLDVVILKFGTEVYIREYKEYSFYKARLPQGFRLRIVYHNIGANDVQFNVNFHFHADK